MVTGIIVGLAIIVAAIILSVRGIHIKYDKTFTIDDKRMSSNISPETLKQLENILNTKPGVTPNQDIEQHSGPMDAVIAEIHDLFGPGSSPKKDDRR